MKLYHFNPNNYGEEAYVLAESPEKAKEYLLNQILPPNIIKGIGINNEDFDQSEFHNEKINDMVNLKYKYTLDEYGVGEVVFSEIS